jgi:hypothetical protein
MSRLLLIACLLGIVTLQGCASGPSLEGSPYYRGPAESSDSMATVYIFREKHSIGSAVTQNVSIDGKLVGSLPNGGYLVTRIGPGSHEMLFRRANFLHGDLSDAVFKVELEVGKTYFIAKETSSMPYKDSRGLSLVEEGSFRLVRYYFRWAMVPKNEAEMRMKSCRLVPASQP